MVVAATGITSVQLDDIIDLIANSATFQTWVGAETPAAAKSSIYVEAIPTNPVSSRPFAIITIEQITEQSVAGGSKTAFAPMRTYGLAFEMNITAGDTPKDAAYRFFNSVDAIWDEIKDLTGTGAYINIDNFQASSGPFRASGRRGKNDGDYMFREHTLTVGFESSGGEV